jgi:hypothetical protein
MTETAPHTNREQQATGAQKVLGLNVVPLGDKRLDVRI